MGDLLTHADLSRLYAEHKSKGALATIALKQVDDVTHFGVAVLDKNGWIKEFQEKPKQEEARSNLASAGIYILEPEIFDFISKAGTYGFGKQLFPQLVHMQKPILGIEINDYWSDVGTFDQYRQANFDALSGKIELMSPVEFINESGSRLWKGKNSCIGPNCVIDGQLLLGDNSVISQGAKISGSVVIGENCWVEEGALIKDSVVWAGSRIGKQAQITSSILGLNSRIEPGKLLNEAAFVVPKNSTRNNGQQLLCR